MRELERKREKLPWREDAPQECKQMGAYFLSLIYMREVGDWGQFVDCAEIVSITK